MPRSMSRIVFIDGVRLHGHGDEGPDGPAQRGYGHYPCDMPPEIRHEHMELV